MALRATRRHVGARTKEDVDTEFGIISGVEHLVMDYRIRGPQLFLRAAF